MPTSRQSGDTAPHSPNSKLLFDEQTLDEWLAWEMKADTEAREYIAAVVGTRKALGAYRDSCRPPGV